MTQADKVYEYMQKNGEISQREAYKMGIYRLSAVIFDMKEAGLPICSVRRKCRNRDGTYSYPSFYWLNPKYKAKTKKNYSKE